MKRFKKTVAIALLGGVAFALSGCAATLAQYALQLVVTQVAGQIGDELRGTTTDTTSTDTTSTDTDTNG